MVNAFPKISDGGLAELQKDVGDERTVHDQFNQHATADTIRHFARAIGDVNPLFNDEEYGKKTKWGCMIAPPTFLYSMFGRPPRIGLPGVHAMWGGSEFECLIPIKIGDRIQASVYLSAIVPKVSRFSLRSAYQEWVYLFRNQQGQIVAKVKDWAIRTERDTAKEKGKYFHLQPASYTIEKIAAIEAEYDKEEIRGSKPRYWEDVKLGEELTPVIKGPLTVRDNIAWKIGWGFDPFTYAHRIALEYRRRHPGVRILNEQGIPDVPERVHWENEFAIRVGVPKAFPGPRGQAIYVTW